MDQQSSNANMSRSTVETLKQIQKQGLSISIVNKNTSGPFSLPSPASSENRTKQNVQPSDKTAKLTPVAVARSQAVTENKSQIMQTRVASSAETRVSSGRIATPTTFHDNKVTPNQIRSNQPPVSEGKVFNPSLSGGPISSADKAQGTPSRPIVTTPVSKIQTSQARMLVSEGKIPVVRGNSSMLNENKTPVRVTPGQRIPQNQQLIEGKTQTNQDRLNVNPISPPDAKVFSNQARTGQQFVHSQDTKSVPVQRVAPQKSADIKNTNQMSANKPEIKTPQANRIAHNVKVIPDCSQNKARQNYAVKTEGKSLPNNAPMVVENKTVNSVRMVTNMVDGNSTRTTQCKSSSTQMRLQPNTSIVETPTVVQTKMICSTVRTKMQICIQSVTPESKMILQGTKVTAQSSDVIQKTAAVFDMSADASQGTPVRLASAKRSSVFSTSSPIKKKCVKKSIPGPGEICSKSLDGSNSNAPEEEMKNGNQFFNNIKTSRTGLTITPVGASTVSLPSSAANASFNVIKYGEFPDKETYRLALEKARMTRSPRGKARSRGRRKLVEPVCLTLSSDEEEEHMQAQFNNFEEAFAHQARMFRQESEEGSKSGQSSPVYQDENDPDEDPEFPGVTNIPHHTKATDEPYPSSGEEDDEEREMDEMDEEESFVEEEEEEEEEMEENDMEEEEEVPPEDDDEQVSMGMINKGSLESISLTEQPLRVRSVRIGSYKVHPKKNATALPVYLSTDGLSFNAPMVSDSSKIVNISLKANDVTQMIAHFGKCLPVLYILTTQSHAENLRKLLNMNSENMMVWYDPMSNDERQKKITFLIETVNEEQRQFLRQSFIPEAKIREIDQKTANEILVKSTPNQNTVVKCEVVQPQPQHIQISPDNLITVTSLQTLPVTIKPVVTIAQPIQPIKRLFTYPPPPQTGGIAITSDDVSCLNEGEFLNDVIIDFYLKYLYNENLNDYQREKTHIFSSYFFPRLTHKPERARPGDEAQKNIQVRRHSQVKTWTRHVDIFSKDFIVIPVNQNVHWFLAVICFPGLVPEAPESPVKPDSNVKSSDNVTSSDDQDENKLLKDASSTVDGNNQNSDENSTASSNSMFEADEPDSEEPLPEAPDSSTHPDKNQRRKQAPCICIFDSLNGPNRSRIVTMLREYLEIEWKMRKGTRKVFDKNTMQGYIMQCPQQTNYSDCGVYVLQYVESFFEDPLPYYGSPMPDMTNWFTKEIVDKKRQEIKDLIYRLEKQYSTTETVRNVSVSENVPSQVQALQTNNR